MKKVFAILTLLLLMIILLFLPNYPAIHYYFLQRQTISNADINIENSNSFIGDYQYLTAITKRVSDITKDKKLPTPPPKPHKEASNIVYLLTELHLQIALTTNKIQYTIFDKQLLIRYILFTSPPPKV